MQGIEEVPMWGGGTRAQTCSHVHRHDGIPGSWYPDPVLIQLIGPALFLVPLPRTNDVQPLAAAAGPYELRGPFARHCVSLIP